MKKTILFLLISLFCLSTAYAENITVIFTGETRSALYPCHCPVQPDGGIARRATKVKELRKADSNILLLDSGNLFAGGPLDYSQQNTDLDKKRTLVNLSAVAMMQYDAVAVGVDEFNFGKDFLEGQIEKSGIPFVSCNIKLAKIQPYVMKDIGGLKVAIVGVTAMQAKERSPELEISEPRQALKAVLPEIKSKGADIIILLTNFFFGEEETLVKEFPEINVLIGPGSNEKVIDHVGKTIVLRPVRDGRRLGKLVLGINDKVVSDEKTDEMRLSKEVKDDPQVSSILPKCFSNRDCVSEPGSIGQCKNAAEATAECVFIRTPRVSVTVIRPKNCITCNIDGQLEFLQSQLGNLETSYVDYESAKGKQLVKDMNATFLPLFLLNKDIDKENNFSAIKDKVTQKGQYYLINPDAIGVSYFIERKKVAGAFDIFISLFDKNTAELLESTKAYKPNIHFLVVEDAQNKTFSCPNGTPELEEDLRAICVIENYPQKATDYLICRAKNIESSWWDDCAVGMDINKIKACAKTKTAEELLRRNISLNKELQIKNGPTYLLGNNEIFSSKLNPKPQEWKKIMDANK
ncbi:MAG: hypothetical protein PHU91_03745 [Candidatus Omnitrophica bacterium]|nr:hypothetical protein [Candidatus Omnitrophota bacterium]MDD5236754.1 hypothetical protein [Candidatus Omnitrophota bacterium]MDD5610612.1 hypothetical protein [Candidatus Omnitrophota bacterium]